MIEEIATVVSTANGKAVIAVKKTSSCNSCNAKNACGTASLSSLFNFQAPQLVVDNTLDAHPGDQVIVGIRENTLITGSFFLYIVPLLSMFLFALAVSLLTETANGINTELLQTVFGLVGLVVGLIIVRILSRRLLKDINSAVLLKIMPRHSSQFSVKQIHS